MLKVIPTEQQNKFKCYFCGDTRSVKYLVTTIGRKEVPCCNRCALLREVLIEKQNGGGNQCS